MSMETSEVLRIIAKLNTRADRAERVVAKYEQALAAERQTSAQIRHESEKLATLAEVLYETNCRMGNFLDLLIGKQEIKQPDGSPMSFDAMFNLVLKQSEQAEQNQQSQDEKTDAQQSSRPADGKLDQA
ncbi:hypothetical protein N7468_009883 [Penicillium chermesinum]|uniref:Uncharacterized protein n=1 Tax=Penicillium chermesinum TaxID=63820 RepID=A0A9W9TCT4_9EURO|nr:uncharacterized protein N7468_009883 [Penicillium chermesinum]KAJ5216875.1 hypothetical protein N7468_009883 [Penicillium chermesinum]KAJ6171509.1 hypothetical protein N7470_000576 [Penicillium chermesinum]